MHDNDSFILQTGIEEYMVAHSSPELPVLTELSRATHLRTHQPQMLSGHAQGLFLQMISNMLRPQHILEIGTFTGYSAICLAQGLQPNGKLITIECNPELASFPKPFFEKAGLTELIDARIGDALEIIPKLNQAFDLIFIDADKSQYIAYMEASLPKLRKGGCILIDNTLWYGKVIKPAHHSETDTQSILQFNEYLKNLPGISVLVLPLRDGLTLVRKDEEK